jgi:hypothetical protein
VQQQVFPRQGVSPARLVLRRQQQQRRVLGGAQKQISSLGGLGHMAVKSEDDVAILDSDRKFFWPALGP